MEDSLAGSDKELGQEGGDVQEGEADAGWGMGVGRRCCRDSHLGSETT